MKIEILSLYTDAINWFIFEVPLFGIWIISEKLWTHGNNGKYGKYGNEFVIGISLGSKIYERRWGR